MVRNSTIGYLSSHIWTTTRLKHSHKLKPCWDVRNPLSALRTKDSMILFSDNEITVMFQMSLPFNFFPLEHTDWCTGKLVIDVSIVVLTVCIMWLTSARGRTEVAVCNIGFTWIQRRIPSIVWIIGMASCHQSCEGVPPSAKIQRRLLENL